MKTSSRLTNVCRYVSCDYKCKFDSTTCNSNQKCDNVQCQCKKYGKYKKDYGWNPRTCICKNSTYLKSISDDSVIVCDGIINVTDSVSKSATSTIPTNVTNTVPLNVMCTVPINSHNEKLRYKYGLLYFAHVFSSDHITCYNRYYLLSLHKN